MIYLIGGPPKCGKTTLAKALSKKLSIPWVSTDTLQCVIMPYLDEKDFHENFPSSHQRCNDNDEKFSRYSSEEIISAYRAQARTVYDAIDMFIACELAEENDFIIEGYHIEPELITRLNKKYPDKSRSILVIKKDKEKFMKGITKSSTLNDWIIKKTNNKETYSKITEMICDYAIHFEKESEQYRLKTISMDDDFNEQIKKAIEYLTDNPS